MAGYLRLGVNIDHVATLRNARGGTIPDPARAARLAQEAGADGITIHLREDRRHIRDGDLARIRNETSLPINLELAATTKMVEIAERFCPHAVCFVPERREERTTEGGLDVAGLHNQIAPAIDRMLKTGSRVSLFIEPDPDQITAANRLGVPVVELHTGRYAEFCQQGEGRKADDEQVKLAHAAQYAASKGLEVHAGHGLTNDNVGPIAAIAELVELNIGHFLISEAVFCGLETAIGRMRTQISKART